MIKTDDLKQMFPKIDFREKRTNLYKILIPFFYEDGDMYDIFLEESPNDSAMLRVCDYGLTLMKLSYDFDLNSDNKRQILDRIIIKNRCRIDDGNIYIDFYPNQFEAVMYQMIQVLSKVSNMDIINREIARTYFYEFLDEFVGNELKQFPIEKNAAILKEDDLIADYKINAQKPIFLFGVNDNSKASKVIITCLTAQQNNINHRSLVIHDDFDSLNSFNRKRLTNTVDKQFTSLSSFKENGSTYLKRELSA